MTDAELVSFSEVRCPIQNGNKRKRRDVSSFQPVGFLVSITNNGNAFSNKIPIVVYDSSCTNCFLDNGVFICNQKDNICVVKGKCFRLSSSECTSNRVKDDNTSNNLWIIGAVLGAIAACAVVCFLVTKTVKKPWTSKGSWFPSMTDKGHFTNSKDAFSKN
ncbi:unnamed protein product [Mytilus edulis]|uniref:Uncharacterized protein n=1 Tax=Mytilus edulis TaxID=6550 RepID=A0A8S3UMI4_MYTED|nr:unnamed protein product [Mytilus edulis]